MERDVVAGEAGWRHSSLTLILSTSSHLCGNCLHQPACVGSVLFIWFVCISVCRQTGNPGSSAVCAFNLSSIKNAFEGKYKEFNNVCSKWVTYSGPALSPRPGSVSLALLDPFQWVVIPMGTQLQAWCLPCPDLSGFQNSQATWPCSAGRAWHLLSCQSITVSHPLCLHPSVFGQLNRRQNP